MYLNDKLFHSIVSYDTNEGRLTKLKTTLLKLERMLLQGKIFCREEIEKIYGELYFCPTNYNGNDCISLSKHISQLNDKSKKIHYLDENAFQYYTLNFISLVLNNKLLEEYEIKEDGVMMLLEVQIKRNIDLKYLEAISMPINKSIVPFFRDDYNLEDCFASYKDNQFMFLKLQKIIELIQKYNIDIPIVDINTGSEYRENKEYIKLIKK